MKPSTLLIGGLIVTSGLIIGFLIIGALRRPATPTSAAAPTFTLGGGTLRGIAIEFGIARPEMGYGA